jgi:hypothetical protein
LRVGNGVAPARCVAHAGFDFVAEEDPAASEFMSGEDVAAGVVEHRRRRHAEEVGYLARTEHLVAGEPLPRPRGRPDSFII